jgi:hypothetical protein
MKNKEEAVQEELFTARLEKLVGRGAVGKACQLLLSDGVQDPNHPIIQERLRRMHPNEDQPGRGPPEGAKRFPDPIGEEELQNRRTLVRKAALSFPTDSAPGPSGLRPDHIRAMLCRESSGHAHAVVQELTTFTYHCINDGWPPGPAEILDSAKLTAIRKKKQQQQHTDEAGNL